MSEIDRKGGDSLVWRSASHPIRLVISARAAERMRREAARRDAEGEESGGLLRGSIERNGMHTVTVDEVEPVAWSFSMAPKDRRELDAALKGKEGQKPRRAVVGYYRTHSRDDLFLNAGDIALIRVCFPDPGNVFLLLKPGPDKSLASRLFFWQGGAMQSAEGDPEFPFGRPAGEFEDEKPIPELREPIAHRLPRPRLEAPAIRQLTRKALWTAAAAAAVIAVLLLAPWRWLAPRRAEPPAVRQVASRALALAVEKAGASLVVRWNANAPAVLDADRGVLRVEDGPYRRAYQFGPHDLRTGSLYYLPIGGDIQLRLEVVGKTGERVVESARVLSAALPSPLDSRRTGTRAEAASLAQPRYPPLDASASAGRGVPRSGSASRAEVTPVRASAVRPSRQAANEDLALRPRTVHYAQGQPQAPQPPLANPDEEPVLRPRTVHFRYRDARGRSAEVAAGGSETPRPVRQVDPNFPQDVRASLKGDVLLGVRVYIDHTGKVTRAQVVSQRGPATSLLADSAVSAAKLWRFEPATRSGRPVPSDTVLNFHFAR